MVVYQKTVTGTGSVALISDCFFYKATKLDFVLNHLYKTSVDVPLFEFKVTLSIVLCKAKRYLDFLSVKNLDLYSINCG